ncbi:hypothetical protein GLW07_17235 [Bacillus hwajinpoensis]|uniref:Uncharacterized protein n=1 Tax=Guptibacillus hwajinpoensis TaxID=208199 RepID=A0A845F300_9BACL|nr:hypothetical protein [Pseudalkalibacillus hwajinpoensis]MYL65104.1 hypothetical protein [Pseudalkalibacillus hwajinpoensis]
MSFKAVHVPLSLLVITSAILFIGTFYQMFTISEMVLFSLLLIFLIMVICDVQRSSLKEKNAKWPQKYMLMSGAFILVSFLS